MDQEDEQFSPSTEWVLRDCRLVAITREWTTEVEDKIDLAISEGRSWEWYPDDDTENSGRTVLRYKFEFRKHGGEEPDEMMFRKARIVIGGHTDKGSTVKIFGRGWIGRDNVGQIEGAFDRPPKVILAPLNEPVHDWPLDRDGC